MPSKLTGRQDDGTDGTGFLASKTERGDHVRV
jgi:hypothetical protein